MSAITTFVKKLSTHRLRLLQDTCVINAGKTFLDKVVVTTSDPLSY